MNTPSASLLVWTGLYPLGRCSSPAQVDSPDIQKVWSRSTSFRPQDCPPERQIRVFSPPNTLSSTSLKSIFVTYSLIANFGLKARLCSRFRLSFLKREHPHRMLRFLSTVSHRSMCSFQNLGQMPIHNRSCECNFYGLVELKGKGTGPVSVMSRRSKIVPPPQTIPFYRFTRKRNGVFDWSMELFRIHSYGVLKLVL